MEFWEGVGIGFWEVAGIGFWEVVGIGFWEGVRIGFLNLNLSLQPQHRIQCIFYNCLEL